MSPNSPHIPVPHRVEDGLRAVSQRGSIGQSWWARRFVAPLEAARSRNDLEQGRRYARKGQVVTLETGPGRIAAVVQGTRREPYHLRIRVGAFPPAVWDTLMAAFAERAMWMARLLAGDLPREFEDLVAAHGARLFPETPEIECECREEPPWCKHAAAVYYLLAERLDLDPFVLLELRGRSRDEILVPLRRRWGEVDQPSPAVTDAPVPLRDGTGAFYAFPRRDGLHIDCGPVGRMAVLDLLGFPPFFPAGDRTVVQTLQGLYDES